MTKNLTPCLICRKKNDRHMLDLAHMIKQEVMKKTLSNTEIDDFRKSDCHFNWNIHTRCQYGISCPELNRTDNQAKNEFRNIEPYLFHMAIGTDENAFRRVTMLMSGEFPQIIHELNRVRMTHKKGGK